MYCVKPVPFNCKWIYNHNVCIQLCKPVKIFVYFVVKVLFPEEETNKETTETTTVNISSRSMKLKYFCYFSFPCTEY